MPSTARVAWLLTRLRLRRMLNSTGAAFSAAGRRWRARAPGPGPGPADGFAATGSAAAASATAPQRSGTPSKPLGSWPMAAGLGALMAASVTYMAVVALEQLSLRAGYAGANVFLSPSLVHVLAVELALLMLTGTLMVLGQRELAQADWDLEWLVTLPARTSTLLWSRVAERTVVNPYGVLSLWPACGVLAWDAGHAVPWAAVLGLLCAVPLLMLMAMARTLVDTGLRLRLAPSRLRNLQAGFMLVGLPLFYLALSPAMADGGSLLIALARPVPDAVRWTPPGLVLQALGADTPAQALGFAALLVAQVLVAMLAGMALLAALLRHGVAAASVREAARGARQRPAFAALSRAGWLQRLPPRSPVQRRELTLLARDRSFLVQTLVLPLMIVGLQWMANGRLESWPQFWVQPRAVAAAGFAVAAYALMLSAFATLTAEGGALWLLYTFPRSIGAVLYDKAMLWAVLALAYPAAAFGGLLALGPAPGLETLGLMALVAVGVPLYALIAVALGVYACNPQAVEPGQRVKPSYVYLYTLLSGLFTYAVYAPRWWQSLVFMVLAALLALALWQKARDRLPFLLDPVSSPPARVSTSDGLIAAMLFFALQVLADALFAWGGWPAGPPRLAAAFAVAGGLACAGVRWTQWRGGVRDVPAVFGPGWGAALRGALPIGLAAAAVGWLYLECAQALGLLDEGRARWQGAIGQDGQASWLWALGLVAVLAAPLFEEFIFRGLIFGGLRRSLPWLPAASASAAIFAIVHPPLSMLPVFALGLAAAWAHERHRLLLAPMLVHAVYNAAVIAWQWAHLAGRG